MGKTKLFAPIFDISKDILEKGRFCINFVPITVLNNGSTTTEIDGCDIPSGTLLRITDYNVTKEDDKDVYEVIGVSYVNLDKVHIVGSTETDLEENASHGKFYLYDEVRAGESILDLLGDHKVKTLVDGYKIDANGNVELVDTGAKTEEPEKVEPPKNGLTIDEIVKDEDDEDEPDFDSMATRLKDHFNGNDEEVEESKKEDKPHKTFIGNPNEQTKKEVRKPFNPNNNQNHKQNGKNNQPNFISRNPVNNDKKNEKPRKATYASSGIDFGAIVSKTFPRN